MQKVTRFLLRDANSSEHCSLDGYIQGKPQCHFYQGTSSNIKGNSYIHNHTNNYNFALFHVLKDLYSIYTIMSHRVMRPKQSLYFLTIMFYVFFLAFSKKCSVIQYCCDCRSICVGITRLEYCTNYLNFLPLVWSLWIL